MADLHPFCTEAYSLGVSAAPLVSAGIAYYVTWSGAFVALDYTSCRVLWQTNVTNIALSYKPLDAIILSLAKPVSRTTPVMQGNVLFIGTQANALLLAVDKRDGKLINKVQISKHPLGIITQSPTVWQGRIFVGSSSAEESAAAKIPGYICCSFIASMNAFILKDDGFELLWSQDMIPPGSNFSGAAIWGAQPSIDPIRNQVFIATGNVYSTPPQYTACLNKTTNTSNTLQGNSTNACVPQGVYQEAVLAFDAATGQINWSHQLSPLDAWTVACTAVPVINPLGCPPSPGPDADFGMAPSFVPASEYTPFGTDTLVVGQKNGNLYAIGAQTGELFWATATSPDGIVGGLIWGLAVGTAFFFIFFFFKVVSDYSILWYDSRDNFIRAYCLLCNIFNSANHALESQRESEREMLMPSSLRCDRSLLHRSQRRWEALAAPKRHFTLQQCIRRLESDNREDYMGDAGTYQRFVAGAAVCRQRCCSGRES